MSEPQNGLIQMRPHEHRKPETWDNVFFAMAYIIAKKSKDPSTQCGAVLVGENNQILSTGFNGPPTQLDDEQIPWNIRPNKYAYIMHADENALWHAVEAHGRKGLIGSKMYLTAMPCTECTLRMIWANVSTVCIPNCHKPYPLSKYQVDRQEVIDTQKNDKLQIIELPFKLE